eukprot:TRINITY_DN16540_c0_g1_i1.p1 TRINITY_DN16540_c0_g1~~TRINITY_DN16540_c0_g1_i1.p1  ORF type:complete len:180 (+),score=38.74 TRINITY_DN16540_c0_g1_i1:1-540(+)
MSSLLWCIFLLEYLGYVIGSNSKGFFGCFEDSGDVLQISGHALTYQAFLNRQDLTPPLCNNLCNLQNCKYYGLLGSNHCFCGKTVSYPPERMIKSSLCSLPCSGNETFVCGGPKGMAIYKDMKGTSPVIGQVKQGEMATTSSNTKWSLVLLSLGSLTGFIFLLYYLFTQYNQSKRIKQY